MGKRHVRCRVNMMNGQTILNSIMTVSALILALNVLRLGRLVTALQKRVRKVSEEVYGLSDSVRLLIETLRTRFGNTYYIGPGGDDANDGLTMETRKASMAGALKVATYFDTVVVSPGKYYEQVKLSNPMPVPETGRQQPGICSDNCPECEELAHRAAEVAKAESRRAEMESPRHDRA